MGSQEEGAEVKFFFAVDNSWDFLICPASSSWKGTPTGAWGPDVTCRVRKLYFITRTVLSRSSSLACGGSDGGHVGIAHLMWTHSRLRLLSVGVHEAPMPRAPLSDSLCRLSAYLEELEAVELKKFKLYLGALPEAEGGRIPWGKLEPAGPLDTAQLLVAHCGPGAAWPLALGLFQRIHRRDLWERGQREDPVRGKEALGSQAAPRQLPSLASRLCPWPCWGRVVAQCQAPRSLPGKFLLIHRALEAIPSL